MTLNELCIAIIDDGINEKLFNIGNLRFNIEITSNLEIRNRKKYNKYLYSHGSYCGAIIKKYNPCIEIGSIKILNNDLKANKFQLIKALEWCLENNIKIINLSLGTIDYRDFDEVNKIVNKVAENGLIIIAAYSNKNFYTLPACLSNVIGVKCEKNFFDEQYEFYSYPFDGVDIHASGSHFLTDIFGNSIHTIPTNSYATPLISSKVYSIVRNNPSVLIDDVKKGLCPNVFHLEYDPKIQLTTDWLSEFEKSNLLKYYSTIDYNQPQYIKKNNKIWDRNIYINIIKEQVKYEYKIDIPIIVLFDMRIDINIDLCDMLNSYFRENGYYSVTVTTYERGILSNSEFMPEDISPKKFISYVYKKYNCDIIIIDLQNNIDNYSELHANLFIYINDQFSKIKYNAKTTNADIYFQVVDESIPVKNQIKELYYKIIDKLT